MIALHNPRNDEDIRLLAYWLWKTAKEYLGDEPTQYWREAEKFLSRWPAMIGYWDVRYHPYGPTFGFDELPTQPTWSLRAKNRE